MTTKSRQAPLTIPGYLVAAGKELVHEACTVIPRATKRLRAAAEEAW
jgi:hypothetical protein